ncbi:replication initiator [Streptomyces sp. MNU76]|uniref:replication initiator n=1 Tax=Streptomyces sp. MNU76 TaxID=2560026 RepID=UPI0035A948CC
MSRRWPHHHLRHLHLRPRHNRSGGGRCRCGRLHPDDDPALGTPLYPDRYDYRAAALWNVHAGALWARFTTHLRQQLASRVGLTHLELRDSLKGSVVAQEGPADKNGRRRRFGAVRPVPVRAVDGVLPCFRQRADACTREF